MRTTLDIDEDVLEAAKEISGRTKRSAGKILSDLARTALTSSKSVGIPPLIVNGFEIVRAGDRKVVTPEFVDKLREEVENT